MAKKTKPVTLPNVPSKLIRLTMRDLRKVERSKKYVVKMGDWHVPRDDGKCAVCAAGSVMACTLQLPIGANLWPQDIRNEATSRKLFAINYFRMGDIGQGFCHMRKQIPSGIPSRIPVAGYGRHRADFYRDMRKLAALLEKHGH